MGSQGYVTDPPGPGDHLGKEEIGRDKLSKVLALKRVPDLFSIWPVFTAQKEFV